MGCGGMTMVNYLYYILTAGYGIFLLYMLFYYTTRKKPGGDAGVGWALGIMYSFGVLAFLAIALLLWQYKIAGLILLLIPALLLIKPVLKRFLTLLYSNGPSSRRIAPLAFTVRNNTAATVHVQLNCWFTRGGKGEVFLFKSFDYYSEPFNTTTHRLTKKQTKLLAVKSAYVSVVTFECINVNTGETNYLREIQPCMHFFDESKDVFGRGVYDHYIDASHNSDTFKKEIQLLKQQGNYTGGKF
ncbi:MAG: hypothetical protein QM791_09425 [Ferruginibacter sp.]